MGKFIVLWLMLVTVVVAGCGDSSRLTLDEKLTRQYQRYDQAQKLVLARYQDDRLPLEQQMISRSEWQALLLPPDGETLSPDDLNQLKTRQQQQVLAARAAAISASLFDFSSWRSLPAAEAQQRIKAFCEAVPKGGMLHIHPWGTLSRETFATLLSRSNPAIPAASLYRDLSDPLGSAILYAGELTWLKSLPVQASFLTLPVADRDTLAGMGVLPAGNHPFERFEAVFNFVGLVMGGGWENVVTAYEEFAARAVRDGVQYVEFTESMTPEELPRYVQLADRLASQYGLTVRFNVAYFRTASAASQNGAVKTMLKQMDIPLLTGIDLLANELHAPALETGQAVYGPVMAANALNGGRWRRTMHAGELGDVRNPRDALLLGSERLGHGVRLMEDPVTLQYASNRQIPIEINLTSNLKLRGVKEIGAHPFLTYLRMGLPVSLSTDDEGIFAIDINDECRLAVGQTDLTYHEYKQMAFNSLRSSFAPADLKQRLLQELQDRFQRFEQQQNLKQ